MIELGKTYRTRDGREVRIYAVDGGSSWPVHGAVKHAVDGGWHMECWKESGRHTYSGEDDETDLIEHKPKITRTYWLAHYSSGGGVYYGQTEMPIDTAAIAITGPHTIEFTEGEGLEPSR